MKVALFTNGIWPLSIGGMQKHSYYLVNYLLKNNVLVDVYFPTSEEYDLQVFYDSYSQYSSLVNFIPVTLPPKFNFPGHYIYESYLLSKEFFNQFERNISEVDLLYIQGFTGWKTLVEFKHKSISIPTILNFHGLEMFQNAANFKQRCIKLLFRPFVKKNLRLSRYNQSLGGKLSLILDRFSGHSDSTYIQGIGISKDWLFPNAKGVNKKRKLVFLGRYERRKGVEELNSVLSKIENKFKFEFHFIGPIPEKNKISGSQSIIYHGQIRDQSRIKEILRSTDILVCPSYSEGMPTVILEAMASRNAIIATDVGAVSELVSNKNGWLINSKDIDALCDALKDSIDLSNEQLRTMQNESYNQVVQRFLWENVIIEMINKFKTAVASKKEIVQ